MIWGFLHEEKHVTHSKLDVLGILWLSVSLIGLMYGFQLLSMTSHSPWSVLLSFAIFIVSLLLFVRQEKRVEDPIIFLNLFKNRTFVIQNFAAAMVSAYLIAFNVYLPMWTQGLLGLRASMAGFAVTPSSIMWIVGSFIAGRMLAKSNPQKLLFF